MALTSAMVLYVVIWTIVFFMVNPFWQVSQAEDGNVVPGTPESAPADPRLLRKVVVTTLIATPVFVLAYLVLAGRWITLDDIGFLRLPSQR